MRILVAGSGVIGSSLYNALKKFNKDTYYLKRFTTKKKYNIYCNYNSENFDNCKLLKNFDVLVNCAFNFSDLRIRDKNINIIMAKNLFKLCKFNNIKYHINISSMSVHSKTISKYGKLKKEIEKLYEKNNSYSIRIGLPLYNNINIGLVSKIIKLYKFLPFFIYLKNNQKITQFLTCINSLAYLIMNFDDIKHKPNTFIFCYPVPIDFMVYLKGLKNLSSKISFKINWKVVYYILRIFEILRFKIGFRSDSLIGLIFSAQNIETKNLFNVN